VSTGGQAEEREGAVVSVVTAARRRRVRRRLALRLAGLALL